MTEKAIKKFNFTKASIETLTPSDKRVFYYDTQVRGLALLVEPSGRKTFYLYRKLKRTTTQLKLGVFPDMPVPQARDEAMKLNASIVSGEDPVRTRAGKRGEATLGETFTWYMDTYSKPRKRSWKIDQWFWDKHMGPYANKPLSHFTRAEIRRIHNELGAKSTINTANRFLILLSSIFSRAMAYEKWHGDNPCRGVQKFATEGREVRLMPGDLERFFKVVDEDPSEDLRNYVYLSLFTGQRKGNVLAMRWDQLDLDAGVWRIPRTKNNRPLSVPLEEAELAILRRRREAIPEDEPWVFPSSSVPGYWTNPDARWRNLRNRAKMPSLRLHDLRRTLASFMVDTGASLPIIGKTLGHESQAATAIYARLSLDPVRQAKRAAIDAMRRPKAND